MRKRSYHTLNMSSIVFLFFVNFVSLIWCVHLNVSNLNCFEDYITTRTCDFTSDTLLNCSGYSLDFESTIPKHYTCTLLHTEEDALTYSKCGCTVELPGFVYGEKYRVNLTDGRTVINSTIITTGDNIKPKAPGELLVMPMENGNYKVTWNTTYPKDNFLHDTLEIQLMYKKKGKPDKVPRNEGAFPPFLEILGSELEPNTQYVVKARLYSTRYSTQFSDWSQEVEWKSGASSTSFGNVLIAIIPVLCGFVIINICAFYWCCTRLKAKWWDKIPAPTNEIKDMLPGNSECLIHKHYDPSSNHTDLLTIEKTEEKPGPTLWISECEQDGPYKNVSSLVSAKDSGVFSSGDSQKMFSDSAGSCSSSDSGYKNVLYSRLSVTPLENTGSQELPGNGAPFFSAQPTVGCDICPIYTEVEVLKATNLEPQETQQTLDLFREAPRIATDCKYCVTSTLPVEGASLKCPFSVNSLDTTLLLKACANSSRVEDGYESFGEAVSRTAVGRVNFPACTLEPCEESYQVLQTMVGWHSETDNADWEGSSVEGSEKGTEQEWEPSHCPKGNIPDSITCASPFMQKSSTERSSNSALNTCSIIQIYTDSSYQRV